MTELATIARPYAEALVGLASDAELGTWALQLSELANMASHPELSTLANNPQVSQEQLSGVLLSGLSSKASEPLEQLVKLIISNHRIAVLKEIASQFEQLKNAKQGAAEVSIISAFPMSETEISALLAALTKRFGGKALRPTVTVDPQLIGGVRVQVGDEVLDSSVKSRLEAMQAALSV